MTCCRQRKEPSPPFVGEGGPPNLSSHMGDVTAPHAGAAARPGPGRCQAQQVLHGQESCERGVVGTQHEPEAHPTVGASRPCGPKTAARTPAQIQLRKLSGGRPVTCGRGLPSEPQFPPLEDGVT